MKNFRFTKSTGSAIRNCVNAEMSAFSMPLRNAGTGSPIIPPIATYISGINRMIESVSRRFIPRRSSSAASCRRFHSLRKPPFSGVFSCPIRAAP